MQEKEEQIPKWLQGLYGGMAYGLAVSLISHPFDTIKCRLQTGVPVCSGRTSAFADVRNLYKGVGAATAASVCFRTVPFIGYEGVSEEFRRRKWLENAPLTVAFIAGAIGGVMRGILETPAEFVKTRQQLCRSWETSGVFRGLSITCIRNAAVIGTYWVIFNACRPIRMALPPMMADFFAGGVCSVGAWALVFPLDTVKSQIQGDSGTAKSVAKQFFLNYQRAGVSSFYNGLGAGLSKVLLANGFGMIAYGIVKNSFQ
eukprot:gnl/MRDRNA2_/MRDRNA2_22030_c0_seq2.p1 gnl/MRDRNA2_/MRDRNA2_22030_c0~~gnl/MRDRNA2_/MRDRNA2_22030_c0_seq2.p1  ORF type:complete len:258 (-),score=37.19 gnl/MRDRNA2_/MRDRNA2_22030_c0_seq2:51-824(-)